MAFNNAASGTVSVQAGTLLLDGGGTNSGSVTVGVNGTLNATNNYSYAAGSTMTGAGVFSITGGTQTFGGPVTLSGTFNLSGGTLAGAGDVTVSGTLNWSGGTMSGAGKTVIAAGSLLNITSSVTLSRVLENNGSANWSAGSLVFNVGTLNNNGSFVASSNTTLQAYGTNSVAAGSNAFNNAGTFTKSGSGTTQFTISSSGVAFNNAVTGSVSVQAGTLLLDGGGTNSGSVTVGVNGTLNATNNYSYAAGSTMTGAGVFSITGGTQTFGGPVTLSGTFNLSGGTLAGAGDVTVSGTLNWSGGTMSGAGKTVIAAGSLLNITSSVTLSRVLENNGSANWSAGSLVFNVGTLNNNGSFVASSNTTLQAYGTNSVAAGSNAFNNAGTFTKSGSGTTQFTISSSGVTFNNAVTGSVSVQAGTLSLISAPANGGSLAVKAGATLSVSGPFANTAAGAVSIDIGGTAGNQFGHLTVSGASTLSGTLNLSVVNGFSPAIGNTFQVMTFGSRSGTFTTVNGLVIGNGNQFSPAYSATNLTLGVVAAPVGPNPAEQMAAALTAAADAARPSIANGLAATRDVELSFETVVGLRYRVECTEDLATGEWTVVADNLTGTGQLMTIVDEQARSKRPKCFYRMVVLPP